MGTTGAGFTAAGVCQVAAATPTQAVATFTCTGVPASANVAVFCSASTAMSTPTAGGIYCRPNAVLNQIVCNTTTANATAVTMNCMWFLP